MHYYVALCLQQNLMEKKSLGATPISRGQVSIHVDACLLSEEGFQKR